MPTDWVTTIVWAHKLGIKNNADGVCQNVRDNDGRLKSKKIFLQYLPKALSRLSNVLIIEFILACCFSSLVFM